MSALKRKAFIRFYLGEAQGNATKAAILAGYSEQTAKQQGHRLLTRDDVRQALQKHAAKADTSTTRALANISAIANREVPKPSARDILKANELILSVNGALRENRGDSRITVNIGFLQQPHEKPTSVVVVAPVAHAALPESDT